MGLRSIKGLPLHSYNWLKPHFCRNPEAPTMLEKLGAGGLAGMVAMTLVYPLYVSQARMALAGPGKFNGLIDFVVKTLRAEGESVSCCLCMRVG